MRTGGNGLRGHLRMRVNEHLSAGVACAISARGFLEPDDRLNVVKNQNFRLRNTRHSEGDPKWIPPRFSSLYLSFCCSAAAAGTAVDVGTKRG
jgi:hypothetical protein